MMFKVEYKERKGYCESLTAIVTDSFLKEAWYAGEGLNGWDKRRADYLVGFLDKHVAFETDIAIYTPVIT